MLTEYVRERFAQLLAENVPRRARRQEPAVPVVARRPGDDSRGGSAPAERDARPGEGRAAPASRLGGPPDFQPSDDEGLDVDATARVGVGSAPAVAGGGGLGPSSRTGHGAVDDEFDDWDEPPRRRPFRRAHVGVVALVLVVGLLCAGWSVLRARPVAIASIPTGSASATVPGPAGPRVGSGSAAPSVTPSVTPSAWILVHVLGAVRRPGVVRLPEGARVQDAVDAAGGLRRDARPGELNLAQVLSDGQQVVIGTRKKPSGQVRDGAAEPSTGSTDPGSGGGSTLDLNRATETQLEALPGVGPVTAGKIIAWREEHSRFSRVEELQEIDGIGPKTYAEIAPHVRV